MNFISDVNVYGYLLQDCALRIVISCGFVLISTPVIYLFPLQHSMGCHQQYQSLKQWPWLTHLSGRRLVPGSPTTTALSQWLTSQAPTPSHPPPPPPLPAMLLPAASSAVNEAPPPVISVPLVTATACGRMLAHLGKVPCFALACRPAGAAQLVLLIYAPGAGSSHAAAAYLLASSTAIFKVGGAA